MNFSPWNQNFAHFCLLFNVNFGFKGIFLKKISKFFLIYREKFFKKFFLFHKYSKKRNFFQEAGKYK